MVDQHIELENELNLGVKVIEVPEDSRTNYDFCPRISGCFHSQNKEVFNRFCWGNYQGCDGNRNPIDYVSLCGELLDIDGKLK